MLIPLRQIVNNTPERKEMVLWDKLEYSIMFVIRKHGKHLRKTVKTGLVQMAEVTETLLQSLLSVLWMVLIMSIISRLEIIVLDLLHNCFMKTIYLLQRYL